MGGIAEIKNFVQLTPQYATAGQPSADQFDDIAAAGYAAVVNLALADSDHALSNEGSLVTSTGMSYIHLPIDFSAPTAAHARTFIGIMQALEDSKVFVHCALNLRVSAFMYLYLTHALGMPEHQAKSPMIDKWSSRMDDVWKDFLALPKDQVLP